MNRTRRIEAYRDSALRSIDRARVALDDPNYRRETPVSVPDKASALDTVVMVVLWCLLAAVTVLYLASYFQ